MDTSPSLPSAKVPSSPNTPSVWPVITLFTLSVIAAFTGGYFLKSLSSSEVINPPPAITPTAEPTEIVQRPGTGTNIQSGKNYYDDTLLAITESSPHKILVATATRHEQDQGVTQGSRVSYLDGGSWTRKTQSETNNDTAINTNNLIVGWDINIDPSKVLKQSVTGKITINQNNILFNTGTLSNNIGIRSLPGYTKFMSNGIGTLTINNNEQRSKILYTRIYSNNSNELQFYDSPFGLTTHWLAFWDQDGNFYHLDSTNVAVPTAKYQSHQLGVKVDNQGRVSKTFQVTIETSNENPPKSYKISFGTPIKQTIELKIGSSNNKAPGNTYSWFMSDVTGTVDGSSSGYGAVEYIHN